MAKTLEQLRAALEEVDVDLAAANRQLEEAELACAKAEEAVADKVTEEVNLWELTTGERSAFFGAAEGVQRLRQRRWELAREIEAAGGDPFRAHVEASTTAVEDRDDYIRFSLRAYPAQGWEHVLGEAAADVDAQRWALRLISRVALNRFAKVGDMGDGPRLREIVGREDLAALWKAGRLGAGTGGIPDLGGALTLSEALRNVEGANGGAS